jgi:hypothetical protein
LRSRLRKNQLERRKRKSLRKISRKRANLRKKPKELRIKKLRRKRRNLLLKLLILNHTLMRLNEKS